VPITHLLIATRASIEQFAPVKEKYKPMKQYKLFIPDNSFQFRLVMVAAGILGIMGLTLLLPGCSPAKAGPNGGDLIPLGEGTGNAEIIANEETGEVMIHTWDEALEKSKPVSAEPLSIESDGKSIELAPHPIASDPAGMCSRFYGQADWVRGGEIQHGSIHGPGIGHDRRHFNWSRCWEAGKSHNSMWSEMPVRGQHGGHRGHGGRGKRTGN
jgi:hypothetical protein